MLGAIPRDYAGRIRGLRLRLGLTQSELAERIGVAYVSVNRWERGRTTPNALAWREIERLEATPAAVATQQVPVPVDFGGAPDRVAAVVEAYRLGFGHMFNPAFATEVSAIDPLPHQRLAVYGHMLKQWPLRFLLADDAGAGKTIMTGLYIRERLARRTIRRVIVVTPAGLVGNWRREMRSLFRLPFKVVTGADARSGNPFVGPDSDLVIVSVDTLSGERMFSRLREAEPYDLVVFDEAHKLSADRDGDLYVRKRTRYLLAEALIGLATEERWRLGWAAPHLLLLTATPHQGKNYPYYMLWRLLLPDVLTTWEAFDAFPPDRRARHFIRRTKEEMVTLDGRPLYPQRVCDTIGYGLSKGPGGEQELYEATTAYMQTYYNRAAVLNRSAAKLAMGVFQRRLASSTWAILRSFERRIGRLEEMIKIVRDGGLEALTSRQHDLERRAEDPFAGAAEDDVDEDGEKHERTENDILGATAVSTLAELMVELEEVRKLERMARQLVDGGRESKFDKMREFLRNPKYLDEKVIVYTEHRDTAEHLVRRLQGLGHAGEVALIHGGLDFKERDAQVELFRKPAAAGGARYLVATDAAAEGINLQFCWIMVNFDIPWNPARLEQRMGRIHRYGQKHDPVVIVNLVSTDTREGRVMQTLLHKLEEIRGQLGSDKVFDVIGRLFSDVSLTRYLEDSLGGEDADAAVARLEGTLTAEQVQALAERERRIYGDGGDVKVGLPALRESLDAERYVALLPGYTRRFLERTSPGLGLRIGGDPETGFTLMPLQAGAMDFLEDAFDDLPETSSAPKLSVRRPDDKAVAWVHPGEPVFDAIADRVISLWATDATRGGVFTDPAAEAPYLVHVGRVDIAMAPFQPPPADGELAFDMPPGQKVEQQQVIERRLFAVRQVGDGSVAECAVEHLLLLRGVAKAAPGAYPLARSAQSFLPRVEEHARGAIGAALVVTRRDALVADLELRLDYVRRGFGYQEAELAKRRAILYQSVRDGDALAGTELDLVRERQKALRHEWQVKLAEVESEPERVGVGEVRFLARALVLPTTDPDEIRDFEARVEDIAIRIAAAHEQSRGCQVLDVSKPDFARRAGLVDWPGFDLQSRHPGTGDRRCVEVKGRAGTTGVELTENEWAKACNLRAEYWLYVVFDCATPRPRLLKIRDPFGALIWRQRGVFRIEAATLIAAAEQTEAET